MSDSPPRVVMISSTCRDLPKHRDEVRNACLEMRCLPRMMEHLPASNAGAVGASLALVDEADIYVGVFGHRYGYVPRGETRSITHMEYDRAWQRGMPILIFIVDFNHRVHPADFDTGHEAERLRALKLHLETSKNHVVKYFRSPKDLHAKVLLSLGEHLRKVERGEIPPRSPSPAPIPSLPVGAPADVDPQALQAARQQLFRIEARGHSDSNGHQLIVNLGFSRVWIRDAAGRRLPVVCGCAMARSEIHIQGGRSHTDPACALPPEARVVVEFGTGPRPVVRLETCPPRPFLEGRAQLVFEIKHDTLVAGSAVPRGPLTGLITVEPEWFAAERPAGVPGQQVTEEIEALLNAWLDGLQRQSPATLSFTL